MPRADDRWVLARHRLHQDLGAMLWIWAIFLVLVLILTGVVSAFRTIEVSGWEIAGQIPRWYLGAVGVYLTSVHLPLYVAHGYTRRESFRQLAVVGAIIVAIAAVLMTLGFVVERLVYAIAGWPQAIGNPHLFADAAAYPAILLEFVLVFAIWAVGGSFVGASFYRSPTLGMLSIPVGIAGLIVAEGLVAPGFNDLLGAVPFLERLALPEGGSIALAVPLTVVAVVVLLAATWLVTRDVPLRPEPS